MAEADPGFLPPISRAFGDTWRLLTASLSLWVIERLPAMSSMCPGCQGGGWISKRIGRTRLRRQCPCRWFLPTGARSRLRERSCLPMPEGVTTDEIATPVDRDGGVSSVQGIGDES